MRFYVIYEKWTFTDRVSIIYIQMVYKLGKTLTVMGLRLLESYSPWGVLQLVSTYPVGNTRNGVENRYKTKIYNFCDSDAFSLKQVVSDMVSMLVMDTEYLP
jgi:hypothetical protein